MKMLIISDTHSNYVALFAVAHTEHPDAVLIIDEVGYLGLDHAGVSGKALSGQRDSAEPAESWAAGISRTSDTLAVWRSASGTYSLKRSRWRSVNSMTNCSAVLGIAKAALIILAASEATGPRIGLEMRGQLLKLRDADLPVVQAESPFPSSSSPR
jgi:hypothetical protein